MLVNSRALDPLAIEVLVVDGGSCDAIRAIATAAGVEVWPCETAGRVIQMNTGAWQSRGNLLCFLYADTLVPTDLVAIAELRVADEWRKDHPLGNFGPEPAQDPSDRRVQRWGAGKAVAIYLLIGVL